MSSKKGYMNSFRTAQETEKKDDKIMINYEPDSARAETDIEDNNHVSPAMI